MRRAVVLAPLVAAFALAGSASAALTRVAVPGGPFASPIYVAAAPGDDGIFVVERAGRIVRVARRGSRSTFLDMRDLVSEGGERGMFSVAFHPRYATNRKFYVNYTNNGGDVVVSRFVANRTGTAAVESTRLRILAVEHSAAANHNGGTVFFTSRCGLHVSIGDGGGAGDPDNSAQRLSTRLGKLVRIDVCTGRTAIVAMGLRNPWRAARDPATGIVYVADVGQGAWEEIDVWRPWWSGVENFGWRRYEGGHRYSSTALHEPTNTIWPIHEYSHAGIAGEPGCRSITGGFVYRGRSAPDAAGRYFFGDYCTGRVWSFRYQSGRVVGFRREPGLDMPDFALVSSGRGPAGGLYLVNGGGTIYRLAQT